MGPPTVPPNMFQRSLSLGTRGFVILCPQLFAFSLSFRKNSQTSPWNWLVPDLIEALTIPPWKLPNSADAFWVIRLNSWIASGTGVYPRRLSETWLLSMPSRTKLLDCSRLPLMNGLPPLATLSPVLKLEGLGVTAPGESSVNCT